MNDHPTRPSRGNVARIDVLAVIAAITFVLFEAAGIMLIWSAAGPVAAIGTLAVASVGAILSHRLG